MVRFPGPRLRAPFFMHDMILRQPEFVREALARTVDEGDSFLGRPRGLVLTGCGTSFHAALYGAAILRQAYGLRRPVWALPAYDLLHGAVPPPGATVLGISHGGATGTTNRALEHVRRGGLRTLGLCGVSSSNLERIAERTLVIGSVHDRSWANTMSYTTQLTALACLAAGVAGPGWSRVEEGLRGIPALLKRALRCESQIRRIAKSAVQRDRMTFLGSGLDSITALEAALKIRETSGFPASGYHPEQFLHGPFLSVDRREGVVALLSRDDGPRAREIVASLRTVGARVTTVGEGLGTSVRLPRAHRLLRPLVSILPLQLLAYHAALAVRSNPDIMRSDRPAYARALGPMFR